MTKYHVYLNDEWTATYDGNLKDAEKLAKQAAFQINGKVIKEIDDQKFLLDEDEIPM
jgi:Rps23 Pro-64 3,4-dihydroxylase Tpa1-like proline 4-hydroxylase